MANKSQRKKRVGKSLKQPKPMVKRGNEPRWSDSPLTFDFSKPNWIQCVSLKGFTNKLKDEKMFTKYMVEVFHKIMPILHEYGREIVRQGGTGSWKHCHPIAHEKLDLVIEIAKQLHGEDVINEREGSQLWQFGITGSVRLIAIHNYTDNYITPLFIDYHHQIHPSIKHNRTDYKSYDFCPVETFC